MKNSFLLYSMLYSRCAQVYTAHVLIHLNVHVNAYMYCNYVCDFKYLKLAPHDLLWNAYTVHVHVHVWEKTFSL